MTAPPTVSRQVGRAPSSVSTSADDGGRPEVHLPPAVLMGAEMVTAVSLVRSLAREGVDVYLLCRPDSLPAYSRYARRLAVDGGAEGWLRYLLDPESRWLEGAVLLACNDDAIQLLIDHHDELAGRFILDISDVEAQRCLLNKLSTYEKAAEVGIPTPRFWRAPDLESVRRQRADYVYPLILKPLYSHQFKRLPLDHRSGAKYLVAHDYDQLVAMFGQLHGHGVDVVLMEEIPGADDLLCSYYTYMDEDGAPLFDFTKRIIRRFPVHQGPGCYHITDWNPEVKELGLRLFRHVGLRGLGNVEFKRDPRDGALKVIECNARFTAANGLLVAAGYDLGRFVYNRLVGRPQAPLAAAEYERGLRLWYPVEDFKAFVELRRQGQLDFGSWLRGVLHPQVLPYYELSDPMPSAVRLARHLRGFGAQAARFVLRRPTGPLLRRPSL
jgi:D-aspartate ligase